MVYTKVTLIKNETLVSRYRPNQAFLPLSKAQPAAKVIAMSKDRDLIFDMTEDPEVLTYPAADNEPLQLGGVGDDAASAADRQVTTPGDVHVAPQMPDFIFFALNSV